jgi:hypothetical protein
MDVEEFRGATFQRVYQYLRRHAAKVNLDQFQYQATTEGTPHDCLQLFLQYVMFHTLYLPCIIYSFHIGIVELRTLPGQKFTTLPNF